VAIALAIKLDSSGPVFFCQERVGQNRRRGERRRHNIRAIGALQRRERRKSNQYGRLFTVYKFRTMIVDAEKRCGPIWASRNDPRVTAVGRFLRRTRLDELPQLLNVLRGEMSIVGPRPERPYFVEKLAGEVDGYVRRLEVKPGITGLAQVENGYDGSVDDVRMKVKYDLSYIKSSSLKHDLLIMIKTIGVVLSLRGM
jgi:lipopolysaccharide/colanic/teichoic acid biosynthesis glycosyltransferase